MTLGRPLQFDPEQALESAMQLFWRKGYEATSLQDLLQATGLSKSSLYQTFGNKHTLFEQCVEHYRRNMIQKMQEMLAQASSGRAFIKQLFLGVFDETQGENAHRGCLIMNTASEFAQSDPVIAKLVTQGTKAFAELFQAAITQAIAEGDIPPKKDVKVLASYLMASLTGLKTLVKSGTSAEEVKAITGVILSTLE